MATYLLTWNPDRWHWTEEEILEDIAQIDNLGLEVFNRVNDNSLDGASAPTIKESNQATVYSLYGSAVSLAAFSSGYAASYSYQDDHWDGVEGHLAWYVDVYWDTLLNPYDPRFMPLREELEFVTKDQRWSPLSSAKRSKRKLPPI